MFIRRKLTYKIDFLNITDKDLSLEKINSDISNIKEICKEQKHHLKIYDISEDYLARASNITYFLKDFVKEEKLRTKSEIGISLKNEKRYLNKPISLLFIHSYLTEIEANSVFNSLLDIVPRYRLFNPRTITAHNFQSFIELEFINLNKLKISDSNNELYHCIFIIKISGQIETDNNPLKIVSIKNNYRYFNILNPYIPFSNFKRYTTKNEKPVLNDYSFIDILFNYIPTSLSYYNKYIAGILEINREYLKKYFNLEQAIEIKERINVNNYFPFSTEENSISFFNKIFLEDILTFKSNLFNYYFDANRIEGFYFYLMSTLFKDTLLFKETKKFFSLIEKDIKYPLLKEIRKNLVYLNTKYKEEIFSEDAIKGLQVLTLFIFFTSIIAKTIIESKGFFHSFYFYDVQIVLLPWFNKTSIVNLFICLKNLNEEDAVLNITKGYAKAIDFIYDNFKFAKRIYEIKNPENTSNYNKNIFIHKSIQTAIKTKNSIEKSRKKTTEEKICLLYLVDMELLNYIIYSFDETTENILSKIVIIKTSLRRNIL